MTTTTRKKRAKRARRKYLAAWRDAWKNQETQAINAMNAAAEALKLPQALGGLVRAFAEAYDVVVRGPDGEELARQPLLDRSEDQVKRPPPKMWERSGDRPPRSFQGRTRGEWLRGLRLRERARNKGASKAKLTARRQAGLMRTLENMCAVAVDHVQDPRIVAAAGRTKLETQADGTPLLTLDTHLAKLIAMQRTPEPTKIEIRTPPELMSDAETAPDVDELATTICAVLTATGIENRIVCHTDRYGRACQLSVQYRPPLGEWDDWRDVVTNERADYGGTMKTGGAVYAYPDEDGDP